MTTETLVTLRDNVAAEIKAHLDTVGTSYIKIGELLNEVRADFDKQSDFLSWVNDEIGIKKAQCYKLMNVARVFGEDDRFKGVAMRVMLALIPYVDDVGVMTMAASLAAEGNLNTATLNELIDPPAKPKAEPVESQGEPKKVAEDAAQDAPQALQSVPPAPEDVPFEVEPVQVKAEPLDNAVNQDNAAMAALLDQLKRQNETIEALNKRIAELTSVRESKKSSAPMLPQFKSKCMYARLGLSAEEAEKKTAVNKAKRELVKLGYGEGHEAWPMISEAVDALTK